MEFTFTNVKASRIDLLSNNKTFFYLQSENHECQHPQCKSKKSLKRGCDTHAAPSFELYSGITIFSRIGICSIKSSTTNSQYLPFRHLISV